MYCFIFATSNVYMTEAFYVRLTHCTPSRKVLLEPSGYYLTPDHSTIIRFRDEHGVFVPIQGGIPVFTVALKLAPFMDNPYSQFYSDNRNVPQFPLLMLP